GPCKRYPVLGEFASVDIALHNQAHNSLCIIQILDADIGPEHSWINDIQFGFLILHLLFQPRVSVNLLFVILYRPDVRKQAGGGSGQFNDLAGADPLRNPVVLALEVFGFYGEHRLFSGLGALLVVEHLICAADREQSLYLFAMLRFQVSNFLQYLRAGLVGPESLVQLGGPPGDISVVVSGVDSQDLVGLADRLIIHSSSIETAGDHASKLGAIPGVFAGAVQHLTRPADIALSPGRV